MVPLITLSQAPESPLLTYKELDQDKWRYTVGALASNRSSRSDGGGSHAHNHIAEHHTVRYSDESSEDKIVKRSRVNAVLK